MFGRPRGSTRPDLTVLYSFGEPHARSNPFLPLLLRSVASGARILTFTWSRALFARYDVLHLHWPEHWFQQARGWRLWVRILLIRVILLRAAIWRIAIVATAHNESPHEAVRGIAGANLSRLVDRVDLWITLNPFTTIPSGARSVCIPHGHYRDWYSQEVTGRVVPGETSAILFAGFVRPYKGVEVLIEQYRRAGEAVRRPLRIVGKPHSAALADAIAALAHGDQRISLEMSHVPDDVLASYIAEAGLIVLPYRDLHNSGIALLALSLNRPVLVPHNAVTEGMQVEFGKTYVHTFSPPLAAERLIEVVSELDTVDWSDLGEVDMSRREWQDIGRQHVEAYREAVRLRRDGDRHHHVTNPPHSDDRVSPV